MKPDATQLSEFMRLGASHEAVERLEHYARLLIEWSEKFNLVAPSTIPQLWTRHFLDSAQLMPMLPVKDEPLILADMGSGAGFPGIVLSIMGFSTVHLIESTGKKADFLRHVIETLSLDTVVHQKRVEDMGDFRADIITARALASLDELLPLGNRLAKKESLFLFLKGQNADAELTSARKCWIFDCVKSTSISDATGSVLAIRNLRYDSHRQPRGNKRTAKRN